MGGQGEAFARAVVVDADRNGWLVVAPTLPYGDHMDPTQLAEDDIRLSQMLAATLDALPQRLGLKLLPRVLVFGFSRGAQLGHRFAMFYPDHVQAAAVLSAGSYTLPSKEGITESGLASLPLPYGIADVEGRLKRPMNLSLFEKIPFLIEVGAKDDRPGDVPRQFDYLDGTTRVARAKSFDRALESLGMDCQLFIAPNAGHEVNAEMLTGAIKFLRENAKSSTAR
jgi:predicted esterase